MRFEPTPYEGTYRISQKGVEVIKNTKECNAILKEYFVQYRIKLYNYCLARLDGAREDADDCVQDSFLVLHQKINSGETIENPRAFLCRTVDNFVKRRKANITASQLNSPQANITEKILVKRQGFFMYLLPTIETLTALMNNI